MVVLPTNISLRTSCADVDFLEGCLSTCRSKCAEKGIILVTHIQRKRLQFKKFTNGCVYSQRSKKCLVRCCDDGWIVACGSLILRWRRRVKERGLIKIARILRARARCFSNFQFRKKEGIFRALFFCYVTLRAVIIELVTMLLRVLYTVLEPRHLFSIVQFLPLCIRLWGCLTPDRDK